MAPGLFRIFGTVKRSNVSPASSRSATPSSADIVVYPAPREPFPVDPPQPLATDGRPHPLFKKVQQTWDYRYAHWSEIQRAQKYQYPTRSIPTNTRIVAYNRTDPFGKNNDHVWIVFKSQPLIELMRSEFRDVTDLLDSSPGLDARLVYNKRQSLAARASGEPSTEINAQPNINPEANTLDADDLKALRLLLEFIDLQFTDTTTQVDDLRDEGLITWNLLWVLCEKGTLMLRGPDGVRLSAFELVRWVYKDKETDRGPNRGSVIVDRNTTKRPAQFIVHGRSVLWTGDSFEDTQVELGVDHFLGTRSISDLPFQPLAENLRKKLTDRGKIYVKLSGVHYMQYEWGQEISRIMIDVAGGHHRVSDFHGHGYGSPRRPQVVYRSGSRDSMSSGPNAGPEGPQKLPSRTTMSEDDPDLCLLPAGLEGWNFRTKSWDYFLVTHVSPIEFNDDAFEHLVLQEKYKEPVLAFVNAHTRKAQQTRPVMSDVVKGKGGGMVMLLHGNPGTGKTLTAEAVADYLRRPLYSVSSGELNLEASELEGQLERILKRAAGWDCVVLIDEADIFLQARNNDIQRSSLVSVFLRVLEYHNGVLILTTNRVDAFDKAFRSRIGVALKYPDLDQSARKTLWTKFFTLAGIITAENATAWEDDIEKLSLRVMNGRDIKNAVRGAQALAYQAKKPLNVSHVETVLSIADEFSESF